MLLFYFVKLFLMLPYPPLAKSESCKPLVSKSCTKPPPTLPYHPDKTIFLAFCHLSSVLT